jgi:hypothetical protein
MTFFATVLAPIIIVLCGLVLAFAGIRRMQKGQMGRAVLDIIWAFMLFLMAYIQYRATRP